MIVRGINISLAWVQLWSLGLIWARIFHLYRPFVLLLVGLAGILAILWQCQLPHPKVSQPIARTIALAIGTLTFFGIVLGRLAV